MNNRLRVLRAEKEISQDELANDLKIHRQSVFAIETKKYMPSGVLMMRIAKYFGKTVEEVFQLEETDEP